MQRLLVLFAILLCAGCHTPPQLSDTARSAAPGGFVRLSQGYVHYGLEGPETGETVVLVHGFSTPMFIWERTVPDLARAGFRVLSYDLYGRGYTDRPDVAYDEDLFAGQLMELLNALDIREPVNLVGLSMGGAIATIFTTRHPEKVTALIPHTVFHPVDDTAHVPHYEKHALVSPLIVSFLRE